MHSNAIGIGIISAFFSVISSSNTLRLTHRLAQVHNSLAELAELAALVGFGEAVRNHVVGWAMPNFGVVALHNVGDEEMFDV